jgi:uncharacterized protein (TIGR02246 family)
MNFNNCKHLLGNGVANRSTRPILPADLLRSSIPSIYRTGATKLRNAHKEVRMFIGHSKIHALLLAVLIGAPMSAWSGTPEDEVRALFDRWIAAQNAHDIKGVGDVLSNSPNVIFINAAGKVLSGREEILKYFSAVHKAKVKMEPDLVGWRVVMQTGNSAYFMVPVTVTLNPPGQETRTLHNWMNGIAIKEGDQWKLIGGLPMEAHK